MRIRGALILMLVLPMASIGAEPNYFLVTYSPGASWNEALSYEEQPALKLHHEYLKGLHVSDMIVMGGTAADNDKGYLSVMLVRTGSLEEAEKIAALDPGVQTRLVRADVVPWNVTMSSMRFVQRRSQPPIHDPDQSFSIKRIDPESRLNIDD